MLKDDTKEAAPIVKRALLNLLAVTVARSPGGSALRTAVGLLYAQAEQLIYHDELGPRLSDCFELARANNITQSQLDWVRQQTALEPTVTLGATMIKEAIMRLCLVTEGLVIAAMTFVSRADVEQLRGQLNFIFEDAEETAADNMDQMGYRTLVELHAAIVAFLVETARPLPSMLDFAFFSPMPTLTMANRLYYDGSRADELLYENKVVHPAFMRPTGRALSL